MKFNNAYSQMFPGYPDAVSLQQAAEMLGLNRHTVGELIRSRRLFALKIGRTYRIPKLSVIEFLLTGQSTFPAGNPPLDVVCPATVQRELSENPQSTLTCSALMHRTATRVQ